MIQNLILHIVLDPLVVGGNSGVECSNAGVAVSASAGSSSCQYTVATGVDAGHGATRVTLNYCKYHQLYIKSTEKKIAYIWYEYFILNFTQKPPFIWRYDVRILWLYSWLTKQAPNSPLSSRIQIWFSDIWLPQSSWQSATLITLTGAHCRMLGETSSVK